MKYNYIAYVEFIEGKASYDGHAIISNEEPIDWLIRKNKQHSDRKFILMNNFEITKEQARDLEPYL